MIEVTGNSLTIEQVVAVARGGTKVAPLSVEVCERMTRSQRWVASALNDNKVIYGINTGFGPLATTSIEAEEAITLSRNVILACLVGVGRPLAEDVVRALMVVRANALAKGFSGVRPIVVQTLIDIINAGITPHIPCKGSLGASGDLAPLAHLAVVFTCDDTSDGGYSGQAWYQGELLSGAEAMSRAGIERVVPTAKEGLALTNGTAFMVAAGTLAVHDAETLLSHAEISAALSMEALTGLTAAFHPALQRINCMQGQIETADTMLGLINGSDLVDSVTGRVQDAYSLRCIPQVLGPIRHTIGFVRDNFSGVLNGATDNPLIVEDHEQGHISISGGNFHGQGPAMWLDFLSIAVAEVASLAERRIFRLVTPELSNGLPSMLALKPGLNSGLMMPQYTAAALVSDNKTLCHPDSVDSIPSSGNQEDHVSMGANGARHALEVLENVRDVLAIELMTAAQAIDLREQGPTRLGAGTMLAYELVREQVHRLDTDRELSPDIVKLANLITSRRMLEIIDIRLKS